MKCDFGLAECVREHRAIRKVAALEFGTSGRPGKETAVAKCANAVTRPNKATAKVYAEEATAAQHDTETSARWHPSLIPKKGGMVRRRSDIRQP